MILLKPKFNEVESQTWDDCGAPAQALCAARSPFFISSSGWPAGELGRAVGSRGSLGYRQLEILLVVVGSPQNPLRLPESPEVCRLPLLHLGALVARWNGRPSWLGERVRFSGWLAASPNISRAISSPCFELSHHNRCARFSANSHLPFNHLQPLHRRVCHSLTPLHCLVPFPFTIRPTLFHLLSTTFVTSRISQASPSVRLLDGIAHLTRTPFSCSSRPPSSIHRLKHRSPLPRISP